MFGEIVKIDRETIYLENKSNNIEANYLHYHVIFPLNSKKIVGEIVAIDENKIEILLVGEIIDQTFYPGASSKPSHNSAARIIYKSELELILGSQDLLNTDYLEIGTSTIYKDFVVSAPLNEFFSNHFAIIGNTGSGKSCGLARIIQNAFNSSKDSPVNSRILLFDVYGEYHSAFKNINNLGNINYKNFTTNKSVEGGDILNIPPYLLDVDDLAILLNAKNNNHLSLIEKSLKLVYIFKGKDDNSRNYKNDIIASAVLDILSSGKDPVQIREQVVAVMTSYYTDELNLETVIEQPGYSRTIRQCLNIDQQGKIQALQFVVDFLSGFQKLDLLNLAIEPSITYDLDDLYYAIEFALISEGTLKSEKVYDDLNELKTRLKQIINSDKKSIFNNTGDKVSKNDFVLSLFEKETVYQIININLDSLDDRFAKMITKILSKMVFDFTANLRDRGSYPIHIILEEAHRYIQNDSDVKVLGYNIFERITKEGRKYGSILGMITQRPSELTTTAISQCSNFLVFRMFHPEDLKIIASISSNVNEETVLKVKSLMPGSAIAFGSAFKIPSIVNLRMPDPMPESSSVNISKKWY